MTNHSMFPGLVAALMFSVFTTMLILKNGPNYGLCFAAFINGMGVGIAAGVYLVHWGTRK